MDAPVGGTLSAVSGDQKRTWQVHYQPDGALQETHAPPWQPSPRQTVGEMDRRGSLDPLSAILSIGMKGDAACERTVATFDGRRRIDVVLRKIGAEGETLICEARLRPVAGELSDDARSSLGRPVTLWLARLDSSQIHYPVRLEGQSGLGAVQGRMVSVTRQLKHASAMRR
jgi:hypothetical protein